MAQDCLQGGGRTLPVPLNILVPVDWSLEENLQPSGPQGMGAAPGRAQHPFTTPGNMPDALGFLYFPLQAV